MSIRTTPNLPGVPSSQAPAPRQADTPATATGSASLTVLHQSGRPAPSAITASLQTVAQGQAAASDALASKQLNAGGNVRDAGSLALRARPERPKLATMMSARSITLKAPTSTPASASAAASAKTSSTRPTIDKDGPIDKQQALNFIRDQARATSLTASDAGTTFFRSDSNATRALSRLLNPELTTVAQDLVDTMTKTFEAGLKNAGNKPTVQHIDAILTQTFAALIKDFSQIQVSDTFREAASVIEHALDGAAKDQCSKLPADKHAAVLSTAAHCKQDVVKAILLRTLVPQLAELVRNSKADRPAEVRAFDRFMNDNPQTQAAGMTMAKLVTLLLSKINGAQGHKLDYLGQTFPNLLQSFKQTTLADLNQIRDT